jgi:osmotically inducible protein OsmC
MPEIKRHAEVTWNGTLAQGNGTLSSGSGVLASVPVTWAARTEAPSGVTSPEELIAAAHASCYAMAFSHALTEGGHPPTRLRVTAEVSAFLGEGGLKVTKSALTVRGAVPGLDDAAFQDWARKGEEGCPISNALRGNLEITIDAALE